MSRTQHEILTVLGVCNGHEGEAKATLPEWWCWLGVMPPAPAGMLTWAGSTPGGCTPCGWVWASGSARSSSDEPSCGPPSCGSRTWWTGSLGRDTALTLSTGRSHRGLEFQMSCTNSVKGCSRNCRGTCYQRRSNLHRINPCNANLTPTIAHPLYFSLL